MHQIVGLADKKSGKTHIFWNTFFSLAVFVGTGSTDANHAKSARNVLTLETSNRATLEPWNSCCCRIANVKR